MGVERILFVDDEPHLLAGLRRMLQLRHRGEWAMSFVGGGAAALEAMDAEPFDVVVSDFRMPGIDGAQLLSEVRVRHPRTVRLILSGHTEHEDLARVAALAHQFLTKPCDPEELKRTVAGTLRLGRECSDDGVRAEVSGIGTLPSSPTVLRDLMSALDSSTCDAECVAGALTQDVALSAKVLQLVNSSFFAPGKRTTSLGEAVVRLGVPTLRTLVPATPFVPCPDEDPAACEQVRALNDHALETARLARRLAAPAVAEDAFCAGLLHGCGHLALAGNGQGEQTVAQAGAYLLSLWGLPAEVVEAVARHADPVEAPGGPEGTLDLVSAVQLAHRQTEQTERSEPKGSAA